MIAPEAGDGGAEGVPAAGRALAAASRGRISTIGSPTDPEEERIEVQTVPLDALEPVIRECRDSKTLVGLLWLQAGLIED